jgi:F0F1-type ATP synthase membrane subunit c/vacuolar-type H+-ATPase subunit K
MHPSKEQKKQFFIARLLYMAFFASLFIYALAAELLSGRVQRFDWQMTQGPDYMTLRYVIYGVAIILIILVRSLRRTLLKKIPIQTTAIITAAICESPAILGLVLFMLTGIKRDFYFLLAISLFLLFMYFPRYSHTEEDSKRF